MITKIRGQILLVVSNITGSKQYRQDTRHYSEGTLSGAPGTDPTWTLYALDNATYPSLPVSFLDVNQTVAEAQAASGAWQMLLATS